MTEVVLFELYSHTAQCGVVVLFCRGFVLELHCLFYDMTAIFFSVVVNIHAVGSMFHD